MDGNTLSAVKWVVGGMVVCTLILAFTLHSLGRSVEIAAAQLRPQPTWPVTIPSAITVTPNGHFYVDLDRGGQGLNVSLTQRPAPQVKP